MNKAKANSQVRVNGGSSGQLNCNWKDVVFQVITETAKCFQSDVLELMDIRKNKRVRHMQYGRVASPIFDWLVPPELRTTCPVKRVTDKSTHQIRIVLSSVTQAQRMPLFQHFTFSTNVGDMLHQVNFWTPQQLAEMESKLMGLEETWIEMSVERNERGLREDRAKRRRDDLRADGTWVPSSDPILYEDSDYEEPSRSKKRARRANQLPISTKRKLWAQKRRKQLMPSMPTLIYDKKTRLLTFQFDWSNYDPSEQRVLASRGQINDPQLAASLVTASPTTVNRSDIVLPPDSSSAPSTASTARTSSNPNGEV